MKRTLRALLIASVALLPVATPSAAIPSAATPLSAATAPVTAPAAPASLTATAGNARAVLAWAPVGNAVRYRIFRAVNGVWDPLPIASTAGLHFTNWRLANGTRYAYRVAAYNRGGLGPPSAEAHAIPFGPPGGLTAAAGDRRVTLGWQASPGATAYAVYRGTSWEKSTFVRVATDVTAPSYLDGGLVNRTKYYYRVSALAQGIESGLSSAVSARPLPPPPATGPAGLTAAPGNARVALTWAPVETATSYRVYRGVDGAFDAVATVRTSTFTNHHLTNDTTYGYYVTARNDGGEGPRSATVTATPLGAPAAPATASAVAGDGEVAVTWAPVPTAATYSVFRGTAPGRYGRTPIATGVTAPPFVDRGLENGPTLYYVIVAINIGGTSPRSPEASATPEGPPGEVDPESTAAFRFLRQATWGPRPGDIEQIRAVGRAQFLAEQFAAPPSVYPATLFDQPIEMAQEHFMHLALTGPDQLRQRTAWALHKIWVVSATEVNSAPAIVGYHQLLLDRAFGNYRDLMKALTLNPAMGRYLNMLNNRSQQVTGVPANENYARELMQLFTIGTTTIEADGRPRVGGDGAPIPAYSQDDVQALARILTGWTFGDGDPATAPGHRRQKNYRSPMEAVEADHDARTKVFLGETFPAGDTAAQDLDHALDVLFNHPNVGPFIAGQLIRQLVLSNPSPAYVRDVASVFADNGAGVRGDLAAVVRAVLSHPEAGVASASGGKLSEPVLLITSLMRALGATVTNHPFMSDWAEEMGQKVFYPPSVFSYFPSGYRVRGTAAPGGPPLVGPEFQGLTGITALTRANFIGQLLGGWFGKSVAVDYAPFTSRARDAAALTDYCNEVFMGGRMSAAERAEIVSAVRATRVTSPMERVRTALYLTLAMAQTQVDR